MAIINNPITQSRELTIDTVSPSIQLGEIMIAADRRNTKDQQLPDSERIRRVVIPAGHWGELSGASNGTPQQGLTDILLKGMRELAAARLRDYLNENPMARTVAAGDFTISNLLAWSADTASSRGSITFDRDDVINWYPSSAIAKLMQDKDAATGSGKGTQFFDFMKNRLAALAAKNHGLKQVDDATKLQALLAEDADSSIGSELIQRLAHIERSLNARKLEDTISIADL